MTKKVTINNTNIEVSRICLGTAAFGGKVSEDTAFELLDTFFDSGGNFLDTANVYGRWLPAKDNASERIIGNWLKRSGVKNAVVATKCAHYAASAPEISRVNEREIRRDLNESLETLRLDKIDFLWLHRDDTAVHIGEIIDIMESLVSEGLISYYGASNYTIERLKQADAYAKAHRLRGFSGVSNGWSPAKINNGVKARSDSTLVIHKSDDELEYFGQSKMSFIPYSSTATGLFAKMEEFGEMPESFRPVYDNEYNLALYRDLKNRARQAGESIQTALLRKILSYDMQIIPITAVSSTAQLDDVIRLL